MVCLFSCISPSYTVMFPCDLKPGKRRLQGTELGRAHSWCPGLSAAHKAPGSGSQGAAQLCAVPPPAQQQAAAFCQGFWCLCAFHTFATSFFVILKRSDRAELGLTFCSALLLLDDFNLFLDEKEFFSTTNGLRFESGEEMWAITGCSH